MKEPEKEQGRAEIGKVGYQMLRHGRGPPPFEKLINAFLTRFMVL
jgi:hypothetical protein